MSPWSTTIRDTVHVHVNGSAQSNIEFKAEVPTRPLKGCLPSRHARRSNLQPPTSSICFRQRRLPQEKSVCALHLYLGRHCELQTSSGMCEYCILSGRPDQTEYYYNYFRASLLLSSALTLRPSPPLTAHLPESLNIVLVLIRILRSDAETVLSGPSKVYTHSVQETTRF